MKDISSDKTTVRKEQTQVSAGDMGLFNLKYKKRSAYFKEGLMIFMVGVCLIGFYYIINNTTSISKGISRINDILMPFYMGIILAYLLSPTFNFTVKKIYKWNPLKFTETGSKYKFAQFIGVLVSMLVLCVIVYGFFRLVIPDLWISIKGIADGLPSTIDKVEAWVNENVKENPTLLAFLEGKLDNLGGTVLDWLQKNLLSGTEAVIYGVIGTLGTVVDVFVALIICVYLLTNKVNFIAQIKKIILAVFSKKKADDLFELGRLINYTFGGFVNGKLIDSLIIGILCFIAMSILGLPLPMLISVIVGITNIIPFFGPFIGAVPSTLIILIINPLDALKFAIMVLVLQQIDGNIIGPKILGKTTKLASFWVMFSIILGGGLFGFVGMILGVPVFAIIYTYVVRAINGRLKKKDLPTDTAVYQRYDAYDIDKEDIFGENRFKHIEGNERDIS